MKGGDLAAADQVLTGLKSNSPFTALRAVLMRAQMAVTNDKQQQVNCTEFWFQLLVIVVGITRSYS